MEIFEYIDFLNSPYDIYMKEFEYPVQAHWHYYAEIIYMIEGSVVVDFDSHKVKLNEHDLLFIYPKSIHSLYNPNPEQRPKQAVLKFDLNELNLSRVQTPWLRNIFLNAQQNPQPINYFPARELEGHPIRQLIMDCVRETTEQQFGYQIELSASLNLLLVNLVRIWQAKGLSLNQQQLETIDDTMLIDNIIEYIDNHSHEIISVADLASQCNMSYSNFARLFKKMYGRSCKEYIEYVRVTKAHDMLVYTNFTLNYISSETGFYDCSHFIRTYKKIMGITPNQQRRQSTKDLFFPDTSLPVSSSDKE